MAIPQTFKSNTKKKVLCLYNSWKIHLLAYMKKSTKKLSVDSHSMKLKEH